MLSEEVEKIYSSDAKEIIEINQAMTGGMMAFIMVVVFAIPVAVAIFGMVVIVRRKFL